MKIWGSILLLAGSLWAAAPQLTPPATGPYRVEGNRILNARGAVYLARGTEMPTLTLDAAETAGNGKELGAFSASAFVSIRQRLNMNAVRLPVSAPLYEQSAAYRVRVAEVIRSANHFELLVILAADPGDAPAHFWERCAGDFKDFPNLFFAPGDTAILAAIRRAGAEQPVLIAGPFQDGARNVIYQATPRYATTRTDDDRWRQFGSLAARAPVLVNGLDPQLDQKSEECAAFPSDPGAATKLVQENLAYFDARQISWTLSSFRPGKMLTEYRYFNWTKLDDGWTCGETPPRSGIAMVLAAHLWGVDPHGLFAVNHVNGGMVLARGGLATAYGPVMAERETTAPAGQPLPLKLSNVSVRVTDSRGVARLARLQYTGAGWSDITFVAPPNAATGPAEVAVVRSDGSSSAGRVIIADVAPGFFAAYGDARGPASGEVAQRATPQSRDREGVVSERRFATSKCDAAGCRAMPIPLSDGVTTTVRLAASGIHYAGPNAVVRVTVGGMAVPVLGFGPVDDVGRDRVTIQLPVELRGVGETDLAMTVNGVLSNVVRINCGGV